MHQSDFYQARWISVLDKLGEQINGIGSILRCLWIINLTASIAGIIVHQYVGAVVAGISFIALLLATAALRRINRTLEDATIQCMDDMK